MCRSVGDVYISTKTEAVVHEPVGSCIGCTNDSTRQSIVGLVVGLPLNMDGSDSPRTQSVRAFARNLRPIDLPILMWDERWSTVAVERAMIAADVSRAKRATRIDSHAAAHILQGAIDALVAI